MGRYQKKVRFTGWDALKALVPPAAFASWMLVQAPGVWDFWWHGSTTAERVVAAAFAAVVLGLLTTCLGSQVDQAPQQVVTAPGPVSAV